MPEQRQQRVPFLSKHDGHCDPIMYLNLSWLRSHVATPNMKVLFTNKNKPKKAVTLSVLFAVFTSRTKLACVL